MSGQLTAKVLWAERNDVLLVTIPLQDATDVDLKITEDKFSFHATSDKHPYSAEFEFLQAVVPDESSHRVLPRQVEIKIKKKENGYWNKIQKGKKTSAIEVDWSRWVDEDDAKAGSADLGGFGGGAGGFDFANMGMGGMGGFGGGAFGDMSGGGEGDSDDDAAAAGADAPGMDAAGADAPAADAAPPADAPAPAAAE